MSTCHVSLSVLFEFVRWKCRLSSALLFLPPRVSITEITSLCRFRKPKSRDSTNSKVSTTYLHVNCCIALIALLSSYHLFLTPRVPLHRILSHNTPCTGRFIESFVPIYTIERSLLNAVPHTILIL